MHNPTASAPKLIDPMKFIRHRTHQTTKAVLGAIALVPAEKVFTYKEIIKLAKTLDPKAFPVTHLTVDNARTCLLKLARIGATSPVVVIGTPSNGACTKYVRRPERIQQDAPEKKVVEKASELELIWAGLRGLKRDLEVLSLSVSKLAEDEAAARRVIERLAAELGVKCG